MSDRSGRPETGVPNQSSANNIRIYPLPDGAARSLEEFLYLAVFVPEGAEPPPRAILEEPGVAVYLDNFGRQPGDLALVAERDGMLLGAVWARCIHGYGHLDENTPELAISVRPEARGQGIGCGLLRAMLRTLREQGVRHVSLAVQKENLPARGLYHKLGFTPVRETQEELILRVCLHDDACQDDDNNKTEGEKNPCTR